MGLTFRAEVTCDSYEVVTGSCRAKTEATVTISDIHDRDGYVPRFEIDLPEGWSADVESHYGERLREIYRCPEHKPHWHR